MIPNELQIASSGVPFTLHAAEAAGGTRTPFKSDPIRDLIPLMPNDSYQLIGKDQMEPSILLRRLRRWRPEDADGAKPLVHVLDEYERNVSSLKLETGFEKPWRKPQPGVLTSHSTPSDHHPGTPRVDPEPGECTGELRARPTTGQPRRRPMPQVLMSS